MAVTLESVLPRPLRPDVAGRGNTRGPVDERAATDRRTGQDRDRPIGRGRETLIEEEPRIRRELVCRHLRLADEVAGLENYNGTTCGRELSRDDIVENRLHPGLGPGHLPDCGAAAAGGLLVSAPGRSHALTPKRAAQRVAT